MTDVFQSFAKFHRSNPDLWNTIVTVAQKFKERDKKNQSMRDLLRYHSYHMFINQGDEQFRINNDFTPLYTRLLEFLYPTYEGIFSKRDSDYDKVTAEEWAGILADKVTWELFSMTKTERL